MIARGHSRFRTRATPGSLSAVKDHANGALNPDAHLRRFITLAQALGR